MSTFNCLRESRLKSRKMYPACFCRIGCDKWRELRREQRQRRAQSLNKPVLRPAPASGWRPVYAKGTMTHCGVTPKRCYWVEHNTEPARRILKKKRKTYTHIYPGVSFASCHARAGHLVTFSKARLLLQLF